VGAGDDGKMDVGTGGGKVAVSGSGTSETSVSITVPGGEDGASETDSVAETTGVAGPGAMAIIAARPWAETPGVGPLAGSFPGLA
jgi:hypothetical protein